jgi:hypothetical protein
VSVIQLELQGPFSVSEVTSNSDGSAATCSSILNILKLSPLVSSLKLSPPAIAPTGFGRFLHPHLRQLPIEKLLLVPVQVPAPGVPESIRCHPGGQVETLP